MASASRGSARGRQWVAVGLLALATVGLVDRYVTVQLGLIAPLLLGAGFLVWAAVARKPGLLVPGGILSGLGFGLLAERLLTSGPVVDRAALLFCLGLGFLSITLLARGLFRQKLLWPIGPAAVLGVLGAVQLSGVELRQATQFLRQTWPFILLIVAIWLLITSRRRR